MRFRGTTNAFSIGSGSTVLTVPKEIANEFEIENETKKTHFNIYTQYYNGKKRIVYEFVNHSEKKGGD